MAATTYRALAVAAGAALSLSACTSLPSRFPNTPLFETIRETGSEERKQILRRHVEARFRVGGPEAGLEDYLRAEGMKTRRITTAGAPGLPILGRAWAREGVGVCDQIVGVGWRADADGVIRELWVSAGDTGCF